MPAGSGRLHGESYKIIFFSPAHKGDLLHPAAGWGLGCDNSSRDENSEIYYHLDSQVILYAKSKLQ